MTILTDDKGRPYEKPSRQNFASVIDYIRAVHSYNDHIATVANSAFVKAFNGQKTRNV